MDKLRKSHNKYKLFHIQKNCSPGSKVLDVGCGKGGDTAKWKRINARVTMGDPDEESLKEAVNRASTNNLRARFYSGDITASPYEKYDVICYNFSLQYIFESKEKFSKTMYEILKRMKVGSKFIGCIPDSEFIVMNTSFCDEYDNMFVRKDIEWDYGDTVMVRLNSPYYNGNFIREPIAHKDLLITWLEKRGCQLVEWSPLCPEKTGYITDMYSKFCFIRV